MDNRLSETEVTLYGCGLIVAVILLVYFAWSPGPGW